MCSHVTRKTWIVRVVKTCTEERYKFLKQKEAIWEWDLTLSVGRSDSLLKIQRRQIFRNLSWFRSLLYSPDVCPRVSLNMILYKSYRAFAPYLCLYLYICLWMYLHVQCYLYLYLRLQAPRAQTRRLVVSLNMILHKSYWAISPFWGEAFLLIEL